MRLNNKILRRKLDRTIFSTAYQHFCTQKTKIECTQSFSQFLSFFLQSYRHKHMHHHDTFLKRACIYHLSWIDIFSKESWISQIKPSIFSKLLCVYLLFKNRRQSPSPYNILNKTCGSKATKSSQPRDNPRPKTTTPSTPTPKKWKLSSPACSTSPKQK